MLQVLPHRTPTIKEMANLDDIDDLSRQQYGVAPWLSRSISIGIGHKQVICGDATAAFVTLRLVSQFGPAMQVGSVCKARKGA